MSRSRVLLSLFGAIAMCAVARPGEAGAQVVVIVSRNNPVTDLTLENLRRLYLGDATTLGKVEKVVLLEHPGSRKLFYQTALNMSEDRVKRHWIRLVFAGENATPPKSIEDPGQLQQIVSRTPGAIAFLDLALVDGSVKQVTIQGMQPTEGNYPLRDAGAIR